ncbi:flagellar basal body rod protein FlgC [Gemmobacter lanyuensis]|uniref:Flagellar basal body rod protein FlgC n=1 Tax=Gemmobacter lanyuensis TaxID=1054497 RepID=A0A918MHV5_9RHOB|nr:flagellar basal body rod protein FlgC [Gemmobacter lanyuensis]GGW25810.1 flagellar basal body rod protein FlgC [Gemmobacter lanyuensis]
MSDLLTSLSFAASGMQAQSGRLRHVSENIANADTPGYRRKTVSFEEAANAAGVELGKLRLDPAPLPQIHDPSHPLADESGNYFGSNVNLVTEIADARQAQRSYEANLKMFDQARQMAQSLLELLRR